MNRRCDEIAVYLVIVLTQSSMLKYVISTQQIKDEMRVHHPIDNVHNANKNTP